MPDASTPPVPATLDREAELDRLALRMRGAQGVGMQLLNTLGTQAEGLLKFLPDAVRTGLTKATAAALEHAFDAASASRGGRIPDTSDWITRAVTLGTGAAGGAGGLPSALAELPVTTTVILRAIQGIAEEHGFDADDPQTRAACLRVFAASGPLDAAEDADLSFLTLRLTVTGRTVQGMVARVAPRFAIPLGQKLAAQAVPVIGAVAGAATNWVFTSYYQDVARVQFGLMRLARQTGEPVEDLAEALKARMA